MNVFCDTFGPSARVLHLPAQSLDLVAQRVSRGPVVVLTSSLSLLDQLKHLRRRFCCGWSSLCCCQRLSPDRPRDTVSRLWQAIRPQLGQREALATAEHRGSQPRAAPLRRLGPARGRCRRPSLLPARSARPDLVPLLRPVAWSASASKRASPMKQRLVSSSAPPSLLFQCGTMANFSP
jgi:hypothetical protein